MGTRVITAMLVCLACVSCDSIARDRVSPARERFRSEERPSPGQPRPERPADEDAPFVAEPTTPRETTLRLGLISARPAQMIDEFTPLARLLATAAGQAHGEVVATVDPDPIIGRLCSGEIDLMMDTANDAARAIRTCNAVAIAVAAKGGELRYRSVIFVSPRSRLRTLADLDGKTILFEDETSTSAYMVPRAMLEAAGLRTVPADRALEPGMIRFRLVGDELNIIGGVVHGRAEAGALSSIDIEEYLADGAEVRPLAESDPVPRTLVLVSPSLGAERVRRVRDRLLALGGDPSAAAALERAEIARFGELTPGDARVLEQIGRMREPTTTGTGGS